MMRDENSKHISANQIIVILINTNIVSTKDPASRSIPTSDKMLMMMIGTILPFSEILYNKNMNSHLMPSLVLIV